MSKMDRVCHWKKQIDFMLNNRSWKWAHNTLQGIKTTIENNGEVTNEQIRAIKNIRHGKNDV